MHTVPSSSKSLWLESALFKFLLNLHSLKVLSLRSLIPYLRKIVKELFSVSTRFMIHANSSNLTRVEMIDLSRIMTINVQLSNFFRDLRLERAVFQLIQSFEFLNLILILLLVLSLMM